MKIRMRATMLACIVMTACGTSEQPAPQPPDTPAAPPTQPHEAVPPPQDASGEAQIDDAIDRLLGDHEQYRQVMKSLQAAVAAHDAAAVAALVGYPIVVTIAGEKVSIADEKAFVAGYDEFMTPAIAAAIAGTRYEAVLVNYKGVMLGSGEAWIGGFCEDDACERSAVKVIALQPAQSASGDSP